MRLIRQATCEPFQHLRTTNEMCVWPGFVKYGVMVMDALRFQSTAE